MSFSKLAPTPFTLSALNPPTPVAFSSTANKAQSVDLKLWPLAENKEEVVEKRNPNSNRFLTSCFLTLARPKKKEDERSRGGGRAKEALCLEVSSACPLGN